MKHVCPNCEKDDNVTEKITNDVFEYGSGESAATLTASVPVLSCSTCHQSWTDYRAENIRHRIICELFGEHPVQPKKLTALDFHEVLHAVHILNETFNDQVTDHPAVVQTPALKEVAERAEKALGDLYQAVGITRYEFETNDRMR